MEKVGTEVIRRVYIESEGVFLEIGPDSDGVNCIELRTAGEKNIEWFGKMRLVMSKELSKQVGEALIAASKELS